MGVAHRVTTQVTQAGTAPFLSCILHTPCAGFLKTGTGTGFQVPGTGTWDPGPVPDQRRGPNTEDRAKRAHRVCIPHVRVFEA